MDHKDKTGLLKTDAPIAADKELTETIIEGYLHVLRRDKAYARIEMSNGTVFIGKIYDYDKSGISLHRQQELVILNLNYVLSIEPAFLKETN